MKTGQAESGKQSGGGGVGHIGGGAGGGGHIGGGGPGSKAILKKIARQLKDLSTAIDDLANTTGGGVPEARGTARKKGRE